MCTACLLYIHLDVDSLQDSSSCQVLMQCCLGQAKEKTSDLAGTAQDKAHSAAGTAQACLPFFWFYFGVHHLFCVHLVTCDGISWYAPPVFCAPSDL